MKEDQFERLLEMLEAIRLMLVAHEAFSARDTAAWCGDSNKLAEKALSPSQKEE